MWQPGTWPAGLWEGGSLAGDRSELEKGTDAEDTVDAYRQPPGKARAHKDTQRQAHMQTQLPHTHQQYTHAHTARPCLPYKSYGAAGTGRALSLQFIKWIFTDTS